MERALHRSTYSAPHASLSLGVSHVFTVNPTIWTTAHTTQVPPRLCSLFELPPPINPDTQKQFVLPGWRFLEGSGRGMLHHGGSWAAYIPPPSTVLSSAFPQSGGRRRSVFDASEGDFSIVIEKLNGDCLRCQVCSHGTPCDRLVLLCSRKRRCLLPLLKWFKFNSRARSQAHRHSRAGSQTSRINLFGCQVSIFCPRISHGSLWPAHTPHRYVCPPPPDVNVSFGSFSLLVPADTIITLTTTSGQEKSGPRDIPPDAPFPLPYSDHYDGTPGQPAKASLVHFARVLSFDSSAVPRR